MLNHHLIICSFNRPRELYISLQMISRQSTLPHSMTIVVTDESDVGENASKAIDSFAETDLSIQVLYSNRGLTLQRNRSLESLPPQTEIVTFIDDDILLPNDYLSKVNLIFSENKHCVGLGGITSDNPQGKKVSKFSKFFMLDSTFPGTLLRSGINTTFAFTPSPYAVEWLPGCCMSYRRDALRGIKFDERRIKVGWGEDVDFSARVAASGTLMAFYLPGIVHTQSRLNRSTNLERAIQNDFSRLLLARDRIGRVSVPFIYLSLVGEFINSLTSLQHLRSSIRTYLKSLARNLNLRLALFITAIRKLVSINRRRSAANPIAIAFSLIRDRYLEGLLRFREFNTNRKKVKQIEK